MIKNDIFGLSSQELAKRLGENFRYNLASSAQENLGVDVLVLDMAGQGYTLKLGGRYVLVIPRSRNWFWQNFSVAHELGHVVNQHSFDVNSDDGGLSERQANAFAAELLMPEADLRSLDWSDISANGLAEKVWELGVSTDALKRRLKSLRINPGEDIKYALEQKTVSFLRGNLLSIGANEIAERSEASARRRVPASLITALESGVADGRVPPESLAYALDVPVSDLDLDLHEPDDFEQIFAGLE